MQCWKSAQLREFQDQIGEIGEQPYQLLVQLHAHQGWIDEIDEQQCQRLVQWLERQDRIDGIDEQQCQLLVQMLYIVQLICDLYATADWIDELLRVMLNRDWHPGLLGHQLVVDQPTLIAPSSVLIVDADQLMAGWPIWVGMSRYGDLNYWHSLCVRSRTLRGRLVGTAN